MRRFLLAGLGLGALAAAVLAPADPAEAARRHRSTLPPWPASVVPTYSSVACGFGGCIRVWPRTYYGNTVDYDYFAQRGYYGWLHW